jgi:hypothetical protein
MGKTVESRATFGHLSEIQRIVDLPGSTDTPVEIDLAELNTIVAVFLSFDEDIHWTRADDATAGATRIADDDTRFKFKEGTAQICCVGNDEKIYIRRASGVAVTDGLSYTFVEGD